MDARVMCTRNYKKSQMTEKQKEGNMKRSADCSPDSANKKRFVLSNITNKSSSTANSQKNGNVKVATSSLGSMSIDDEENYMEWEAPKGSTVKSEKSHKELDGIILKPVPPGVVDFDEANANDIYSESHNAPYIFLYYRKRERKFAIQKYLHHQPEITWSMRAVLVDWLVEVQESFELNHETLYLAVKLMDMYLMKNVISKDNLQLVGATAVLIASKYDERMPPLVDDFLYICDDSYTKTELLSMEINILHCVDFDLGIPISYRFLRRYARCAGASMDTLTLARFILETSLMHYEFVDAVDSKIAAAALLLALKMKKLEEWNATLEYYSGYTASELMDLVKQLNTMISTPLSSNLVTIRTKYSHKIFFEVALVPPLKDL